MLGTHSCQTFDMTLSCKNCDMTHPGENCTCWCFSSRTYVRNSKHCNTQHTTTHRNAPQSYYTHNTLQHITHTYVSRHTYQWVFSYLQMTHFMYVELQYHDSPEYMGDMTHLNVWHDPFVHTCDWNHSCETWLIQRCNMHSYEWWVMSHISSYSMGWLWLVGPLQL